MEPQEKKSPTLDMLRRIKGWRRGSDEEISGPPRTKIRSFTRAQSVMEIQLKRKVVSVHVQQTQSGMVLSNSKFRVTWDLFSIILILYITFATPFVVAFSVEVESSFLAGLDIFVNVFFFLDIALNFRTGFFQKSTSVECTDPKLVAIQYMQGWCLIDLIATVPWGLIWSDFSYSEAFRLSKLIRLIKIPLFMETLDNHMSISKAGVTIAFLMMGIVCMVHWAACLFFFISVTNLNKDDGELPTWMPDHVQIDEPWAQYMNSFYWSVATLTTVGYGDIHPQTDAERLAASIVMLFGGSFYGYGIALMAQLVSKLNINRQNYEMKLDQVKAYMVSRNLPRDLQLRVKQYYKHYMQQKSAMNEKVVLEELSTVLRHEVAGHLVDEIVYKVPIFQGRDPHIISQLVHIIKPCTCAPDDTIVQAGEVGRDMYMVISGELNAYDSEEKHVGHIRAGDSFGELAALGVEQYRLATIRAETYCEMSSISRDDLMDAFSKSPESIESMRELARQSKYFKLKKAKKKLKSLRAVNSLGKGVLMKTMTKQKKEEGSPISPRRGSKSISPVCGESGSDHLKDVDSNAENEGGKGVAALKIMKGSPISPRRKSNSISPVCSENGPEDFFKVVDFNGKEGEKEELLLGSLSPLRLRSTSDQPKSATRDLTHSANKMTLASTSERSSSPLQMASKNLQMPQMVLSSQCDDQVVSKNQELVSTGNIDDLITPLLLSFAEARKREDEMIEKLEFLQKSNRSLREQVLQLGSEPNA